MYRIMNLQATLQNCRLVEKRTMPVDAEIGADSIAMKLKPMSSHVDCYLLLYSSQMPWLQMTVLPVLVFES